MRNLLNDAAKYSPRGAPVELRVVPRGGRIWIEVTDQGPWIDLVDLGRIFERFGRGCNALGEWVPGARLGLYIFRRIVRRNGGDLTIASEPRGGVTFGFELEVVP